MRMGKKVTDLCGRLLAFPVFTAHISTIGYHNVGSVLVIVEMCEFEMDEGETCEFVSVVGLISLLNISLERRRKAL